MRCGFTLIELLVVIAIISILSVVVVLTLNPGEMLKQARDSTRLSDLSTLQTALGVFAIDQPAGSFGTASTAYVSIADSTTTCANTGLAGFYPGWSYYCAPSSTLQMVNGTGWMPVDFTSMTSGVPLAQLPLDPLNSVSNNHYYSFVSSAGRITLKGVLEAAKNKYGGSSDKVSTDGGTDPFALEVGSDLSLNPQVTLPVTSGLKVWLAADAITGLSDGGAVATWTDASGSGNTVTQATGSRQPTYKTNIMNGRPVVRFEDSNQSSLSKSGSIMSANSGSLFVVYTVTNDTTYSTISTRDQDDYWHFSGGNGYFGPFTQGRFNAWPTSMPTNGTYLFSVIAGGSYEVFQNGVSKGTQSSYTFNAGDLLQIGWQTANSKFLDGDIAEVLIYDSALSAGDRQKVETYLNTKYDVY